MMKATLTLIVGRKEGRKSKPEIRRAAVRRISSIAQIYDFFTDGEMMKAAPTLIASLFAASSLALSSSASAAAPPAIASAPSADWRIYCGCPTPIQRLPPLLLPPPAKTSQNPIERKESLSTINFASPATSFMSSQYGYRGKLVI